MFIAVTNKKYKILVKMNKFMVLYLTNLTPLYIYNEHGTMLLFDNILNLEKPTSIRKFGVKFNTSNF
jgi:hypothetical protein